MVASGTPKTVLLVDDNPTILETTSLFLRARGVHVVAVDTALGVTALVLRHHPDVVVLDVMMPALDGGALAAIIHGKKDLRAIPIIFYSAMEEEQLHRLTAKVPGSTYVAKADGLEALHSAILAAGPT
jgi:CheY-like chemotaxis protein